MSYKLFSLLLISFSVLAVSPKIVTIDADIYRKLTENKKFNQKALTQKNGVVVVELTEPQIEELSTVIHDELHRCGGFVTHDSFEEAKEVLSFQSDSFLAQKGAFTQYVITEKNNVEKMLNDIEEIKIREMIQKLTQYNNRYYKAESGVQSSEWIRSQWANLSKNRNDVSVELYKHKGWPQASVILTIKGNQNPEEIVVLGGHADSIASTFFGAQSAKAPGADDNASGISTITEVIRVLMLHNYQPKKTIQFMAYAAEEVGLLGSKEIATEYKRNSKKVIGKMQLDMTNVKGTPDLDIVMMSDFTNRAQNEFVGKLIDEYVKVPWGYSKCGYGCSDHASWTNAGYPASMPFESKMEHINKKIHTKDDVIEVSRGNADHAFKFAQLALSFVVELAK